MAISVTQAFKDALKGVVDKSQIKIEVYFSAAWVDITSYLLSMSGTLEEANFEGGTSANTLNLTLENSDGRFGRKNTSGAYYYSGAGLVPNKRIRVSIVVGSESVRQFTGYTGPWKTEAASMTCSVGAQDTARILNHKDITEEVIFNSEDPNWGRYLTRVIERAAYLSGITWDAVTTLSADWTDLNPSGDGTPEVTGTYTEPNLLTANQQGVETDTTGFAKSTAHASASIARVTTKYLRGAASLQVTKTVAGEQAGAYVNKTSGLVANSAYKGWVYLIADSTTPSVPVQVYLKDQTNSVTGTAATATLTPNAWTRVPVTITTGALTPTDLRLYVETTGATASLIFCADDFWLVKTAGTARATYTLAGDPVMALDLVDLLMPVVAVKGKALSVLSKLAEVVDGKITFDQQGQLVMRAAMYRNDSTLSSSETFTVSSLEDVVAEANFEGGGQYAELVNRAVVESRPLTMVRDQDGDLEDRQFNWNAFDKVKFGAGEDYPTLQDPDWILQVPDDTVLWVTATEPESEDLVITSSDADDLTNETGGIVLAEDPTFGPQSIKIKLTNGGSGSEVLRNISLTARVMKRIEGCRAVKKNATSITTYGQRDKEVSNDFIPTTRAAESLSGWLVENGRQPKDILTLPVMYGCPWLEVSDRITASETITNSVPAAEDFIIKRIEWSWSLDAFAYTITACSLSPDFTPSGSLPASVENVETRNVNTNASGKSDLPPQSIDGTQGLVGLNNSPAFTNILRSAQVVSAGASITNARCLVFDGSYIYVSEGGSAYGREVNKISPLTGDLISTENSFSAFDSFYDLAVGGSILFLTEGVNSTIQCIALSSFGGGAGFTVKASLSGASKAPYEVFFVGSKMYVVALNTATYEVTMNVWNSISTVRQDTPDTVVSLGTSTGGAPPTRACTDGRYIYVPIPQDKIARFDTSNNTATADILAAAEGFWAYCLAHDGQNLWAGGSDGGTDVVTKLVNTSAGYVLDTKIPALSASPAAILYDGTYIWVSAASKIHQISTSNAMVATWTTGSNNGGYFVFDGFAIWQGGWDHNSIYRVPRLVSGRQF